MCQSVDARMSHVWQEYCQNEFDSLPAESIDRTRQKKNKIKKIFIRRVVYLESDR